MYEIGLLTRVGSTDTQQEFAILKGKMKMKRRRNGCGTLISKGKGKPWMAKWKFDGKTYYRSTGEVDKKKASLKLAEFVRPFQEKTELEVLNNLKAKVESKSELISQSEITGVKISDLMEKFENDLNSADITQST